MLGFDLSERTVLRCDSFTMIVQESRPSLGRFGIPRPDTPRAGEGNS
jgi:hypothetical protein